MNSAFVSLRQLIPTEPKTRKLSKIETLRLAHSYIEHLFAMLITGKSFICSTSSVVILSEFPNEFDHCTLVESIKNSPYPNKPSDENFFVTLFQVSPTNRVFMQLKWMWTHRTVKCLGKGAFALSVWPQSISQMIYECGKIKQHRLLKWQNKFSALFE